MKCLSIVLLCFLLFSCDETESKVGQKTTVEVDAKYDAGEVIQGEIINAKFTITNTGDYPLIIASANPSCSCTVPSFTDEPIAPGETGEILAQVTTEKAAGVINKTVTLVVNTETPLAPLVITAVVKRK